MDLILVFNIVFFPIQVLVQKEQILSNKQLRFCVKEEKMTLTRINMIKISVILIIIIIII